MTKVHIADDFNCRTLCGTQYPLGLLKDGDYHMCVDSNLLLSITCDECILLRFEDRAEKESTKWK